MRALKCLALKWVLMSSLKLFCKSLLLQTFVSINVPSVSGTSAENFLVGLFNELRDFILYSR